MRSATFDLLFKLDKHILPVNTQREIHGRASAVIFMLKATRSWNFADAISLRRQSLLKRFNHLGIFHTLGQFPSDARFFFRDGITNQIVQDRQVFIQNVFFRLFSCVLLRNERHGRKNKEIKFFGF